MLVEKRSIRRSDRVALSVPIQISGTDATGVDFFDLVETVRLSRFGGSFVVRRKLVPEQELLLRNLQNNREVEIRIIGQIGSEERGEVHGFAFTHEVANVWDIEFPSLESSEATASRIAMECAACGAREIVYLNEVEAEVFQGSGVLRRMCRRCRESTVWQESTGPVPEPATREPRVTQGRSAPPFGAAVGRQESELPAEPRTRNERRHVRSKLQFTVCIRRFPEGKDRWGVDEEVLQTTDASKGGFGFRSHTRYRKGMHVEVAMPYKPGAANIFVAAQIVSVRSLKDGSHSYGVAYRLSHRGERL